MRTDRPLHACLLAVASLSGFAATPARAELRICEILSTSPTGGFEPLCLPPTPCVPGDDVCSGFTEGVCGTALADLPLYCRPHCGTILACSEGADCRRWRDALGDCRLVAAGMDPPFSVCAYPSLGATYCGTPGAPVPTERFAACHTRPDGSPTSNYFEGNCDGDGCPNGGDLLPCVNDRAPCSELDLTISCSSAPIDAGVPDGGNLPDASVTAFDAGDLDAGASVPFDAGASVPFDAPASLPVSFGGGGGCRCAVGSGGAPSSALAASAVLLATVITRARRKR